MEKPTASARSKSVVTSFDVAARAGVSQSTVSRALRGIAGVDEGTRVRVASAAADLGYLPDCRAARLRQARTGSIAVILLAPDGRSPLARNPFHYDLVCGIEQAAAARGYTLLLSRQHRESGFQCDFEQRREADGAIVIGSAEQRAAWELFAGAAMRGRRVVAWSAPDDRLPTIRSDNLGGGGMAVDHLVTRGRRRIAFVGPGWETHLAYSERRDGYIEALRRHGLTAIEPPPCTADNREEQGRRSAAWLIEHRPETDAIFAACDLIALGVLAELRRAGRTVPGDMAVVGFDGISNAHHSVPALTTIAQDGDQAGERLVAALLDDDDGATLDRVPVRLVIRESS